MTDTKQSGTYEMMVGVCRDSITDLNRWFLVCPESAEGKILFLMARFKRCSALVQAWLTSTTPESKQSTTKTIFALREEAKALAKTYGYDLSSR